MQITGSILQPNLSGNIQISKGVASLPLDWSGGTASNRLPSNQSMLPTNGVRHAVSRYVSRYFSSDHGASRNKISQFPGNILNFHHPIMGVCINYGLLGCLAQL